MRVKYLIILSSTQRQSQYSEPLPAMQRYEGVYPSLLKSLQTKKQFPEGCDVIFVTAQGIVAADEKIARSDVKMTPDLALSLREKNLQVLRRVFAANAYEEVYVNIGQVYLKSIEGFERFTNGKVTYATGVLGRKAVHMKRWAIDHSSVNR